MILQVPTRSGPVLEEALIRIRGELRAVGLQVEVHAGPGASTEGTPALFGPGEYGAIVLTEQGGQIEIRAFAPGLETPVSQSASPRHPGVDAEVVAVRAVEALRAAMVQYARSPRPEKGDLPPEVSEFTRLSPAPTLEEVGATPPENSLTSPGPGDAPPADPNLGDSDGFGRESAGTGRVWTLWLGAVGALEWPAGKGLGGVQGSVVWQPGWTGIALTGQRSLWGAEVTGPEGRALLERSAVQVAFSLRPRLTETTDLFVTAGAGLAHYAARPEAAEGFAGRSQGHLSPYLGLQLGGAHWLAERVSLYGAFGCEVLRDAPRFRFDGRDVAVVGRPTATLGAGVVLSL